MRKVAREEICSLEEYARRREALRASALKAKDLRRVHLGSYLTFLFENAETVRYQVQEMLRVEGRSSEADVRHELATYNELLGDEGELGCTLLIEIDDPLQRDAALRKWVALPRHVYAVTSTGRVPARYDERQIGRGRLSAVQYLKFRVGSEAPRALGVDLAGFEMEAAIGEEARRALEEDLLG
jgi:hypothetical protein